LFFFSFGKATAFWQYGQLFVARIAYDDLQFLKVGQDALNKANQMLDIYAQAQPNMTYF
jgi:hypothetical protein